MTPLNDSPRSLADYLWHWESTSPDRTFASDGTGVSYTYAEAAAAVRALSAEFARRGVSAGDRAAVLAENSAAWIIAFLAGVASGLVVVPLATRLTTDELDVLLEDADPGVIAVDVALLPVVGSRWRDRTMLLSDAVPPDAVPPDAVLPDAVLPDAVLPDAVLPDAVLPDSGLPDAVLPDSGPAVGAAASTRIDGDAPACLTYTSGTTSRPKGVLLSNGGLTRASETYAAMFHSTPETHTIVAVPLCHNTGYIDQLGHALVAGGSIEAHRRFRADEIARRLHTGECTYFIGVPTMYHRILEQLTDTPPCELAPWLAFGGAPMPSQVIVRLHEHFPRARLANCYGLSEATSITHINFVASGSSATEVGVAVAGTIDRISPSGELLVRSPTAMLGYYRDPAATFAQFENGWLRTGDLAARADNGMVQVFGRVDDVINRGGEKVVPLEVEEALCTHPSVVEAAVVGLPDEQYGSIVAAAVVTSEPIATRDLARFLDGLLADYKRPARIVGVGELPRNQNGKVVTGEVRDLITSLLKRLDAQP